MSDSFRMFRTLVFALVALAALAVAGDVVGARSTAVQEQTGLTEVQKLKGEVQKLEDQTFALQKTLAECRITVADR